MNEDYETAGGNEMARAATATNTAVNDTSLARGNSNGLLGVDLGHSLATMTATPLDFTPPAEVVHAPDVVDASVRSVEGDINFVQTASLIISPHKSGPSWRGQPKNTEALAHESRCRKSDALDSFSTMWLAAKGEQGERGVSAERLATAGKGATLLSDASTFTGSAQRTDEGNQVRLAPTCLKSRFSQNKTIRMSRDRETTGGDDTTRAASATNTAVSGVETVRTNSSRRMAIFSRRMIRAARQKKVRETMWASAGNVMSQSESAAVTSNVVRKPRPPDARHRPVLHACSTKSGNHNPESQSMGHVTNQGGEREGISSPALTQTCCEEAASVPLGLQQECVSTTSQMVSSEKDAHDPFEVGMRVPTNTPDHFSLSTVKQGINDERGACVGFGPVDNDAREFPTGGRHLVGCLPLGAFVVKSAETMSPSLRRSSVQETTTGVSASRSASSDSNGLPGGDLRCSPATATATPLDHTPAAEFVRDTGPCDVADAPVRSVDGGINRAQTQVSNPGKSDPTWSDQLKNTEVLAREPQHRESDALDIFPSAYLVPKGEQCEGVVTTALSDASPFTGGSGGPASDITRKYSALRSSEEYGSTDVVVAEGNGTASSVPRDVSPAGAGVGAVLTTKITGLEKNNCGGASNVEVGSCIAVEMLQPFRTSSEIGANSTDGDACEANIAAVLRERSPVDRLCDTKQGAPMATASYSGEGEWGAAVKEASVSRRSARRRSMGSVLREAHIAKLSRWNPQVPGEFGVTTTSRDKAIDRNSGELSIAKVEAVEGLVLPEPLMAVGLSSSTTMEVTFLADQGDKQCALETASSPSDKAVAVDRRAPVPLAPSSKDGLCGSGAKVIKRPAHPGSSEHQDNDPTKQLPTFRRPPRRRSMAATPRCVLTQGSASVCADASEFRCENVAKDAYSKLAVSSGVRHQSVSDTIRQSNVLPPASSGDVPEQGTVFAEKGSVGSRHETKRDDSLSTACCTSESLRIEVSKKKPAVRRSTRRRSMGVVSKGESVVLPLRARGIQCAETCAPPKAVARAESREKTVGSMESAVGCNLKEDRGARQEYGSTQGALVCADNAGGAAPQSSSRRSACHMYAKSGAPNSRSSETTRGKENCSPRTSSILEADDPGKGGHCGVIADVVQECMSRVEGVGVEASTGLDGKIEPLPSLLAAIEAAEACCIKHERLSSPGTGELHTTEARKRVCAVDLSAVDMPRDTTDGSQIPGSAQRTDEGNQVRLAPTCLKSRFSQNKTIRMSRDRETTGGDDTTRAASATNTAVSGVETVRTNSSRRMAIFSRRMIRAARQKKVHERMWASAGNVMSQSESAAVTSNVVRKPRPSDARHRPVLHACSTKSGNHNLESQSMGHVTSQGGEREGISSAALTQTCCEEAASVPLGLQQECVSITSQMVSSEKDAHDPFEVGMHVPMTTSDQFSLSTVKQGINDERDSCVGFDLVDDDAREFPVEGRHLVGCLPPGPFVVKSTEMMSPFLQRASVQELTTAVSATRSAGNDSNGLQSADLRCSPATATATPLDHTPATEFVRGTGPWDVADAPVRSVDGEINRAQTEVSNPGKSDPTRSDQLKNTEALAREPQHRESDALDISPSVYLVPKGEQCEGVVATALSDASAFTGGSGGPASDITRKYSALHSSEEYGPMDVVVAEGNGTASSVPRDVSPAGAGVGAVLTTNITGLEENNCGGASNVEVGSCIAVETLQPFRTSSEIGAIRADGDACEANVAAGLRERSPVDRLCDTKQGAPMATASYSGEGEWGAAVKEAPVLRRSARRRSMGSVLRETHIAKLSRWNPQVPDEIDVTTTTRDEETDRNSGELSVAKVKAVKGLVLPEPLVATFLDDQGGKQCALETASSPADKAVAVDRRAPVPLAPSSKDGLCGSGVKVIKRPAHPGSSEHQENDPTKQLPTFRRSTRRRSMAATPRSVLTQGSASVCADASEFRCENVAKDACSKLAVSSGVRHQSVSGTIRQSNVLPPAPSGDVPEQETVLAEQGSVGSRHATKRDDSLSTACCTSESLRIEVSKKKPAVRRSTRRRSMGVVSKGESVVLPLRARGIQCAETCAPPKAVARAESREKTVGSMESAVGCNLKDRVARQEYGSTQGALVCTDNAGGAAPQSSSRRSACHLYAKSGAPNSHSSETTRGKENCSPRTSSILEADDPGKGGHCGVIADVVQECMSRVEGVGVEASTGLEGKIEPLPSLLAAIEAAEACCIKHERLSSPGTGELHTTEARKKVCAVDMSAVDIPRDTTDGSQIPGSAQRTDEGNQVRLAPTCLKSRFSQNKTIRMSRDRETTGEDDTTRAASATNTAVSGVETVRTNSSRRMAIFSRRMIRAARQKKVHERMWASAGNVMSQSESAAVTSNVVRKPRPSDARHRPVLHACSTKSGNHNLESQSMGHVTSQGGEREGISSAALTQTWCEEAASVPLGLQQECVSTTSQMVSSEKDAHDPFEVGMHVPMTTSDQFSLSTVKQCINDERDSCVGFDLVDDDAREFPVEGRHLVGCLPPGPFVVKSTEMMSPFLQRASVQELTTAVSATRSAGNDSNGLQSADLRCSPATATATPLHHTPATEFVRGTGPWDVADAPVRSVDGEINRAQTEVSNPGKSDPTRSDQLKNTEALAREPQHRESDALDIFPSVYLVPKGEQCEGVVVTALSDASPFTGGSGGPASDITRKYSALHSSEEYGPMDVVVAEGNGTASSVPRDVSPAGAGVGAVLTTNITGLEENNCGGASNVEVGSCIAVETLQPFRTSSEIGAIRADGDACEANVAAGLRERSPVDRLCDTKQGTPMATASYSGEGEWGAAVKEAPVLRLSARRRSMGSVLRETHIAKLSRWNPQVPDEIDVTTTTRDEETDKNSGELSVAKVKAVKGLVLPEPLMATFLDDQGGKQCALETASSPADKAVAVDRRAPVPLAPSSKDGLCGSGVKVIKRPAHPGSSEHQENDPTKQLPTFRRSTRRRSMVATPRSVLTQGSASVCADASEFRCENVAKDACSKLAVSSGVRHQSVSGTIRQSNVLPPASSGDVPEQETVLAEQGSVGSRHATKRDDSLSTACCTSESLRIEVSKKKPAVRRSTRRRSMGVVSKGESVVLPLRARGIQCAETCAPPKAVARAESREKTVGSMESAVGCNLKDRVARQEYGSTQGALVCTDNAGGAAPQSSSRRSACHLYAKSGAPNSHSSETTRGKENCSPRTSSILEADDPGKGGHCGVIADVVQECMSRVEGVGVEASTGLEGKIEPLPSLLAAIEAAEACCIKHERLSSPGTGELHTTEARKRVRFCAFNLSAIDMPRDTTDGSQIPAEDVAHCLNRVVEAQSVVREALRARSNGYKEWGAFLRELRALTVHGKSEIIVTGRGCERSRGDEETTKPFELERREAARFLLAELEPLETLEGPVHTALGEKLGNFLASLVRFKLRTLFNPPPEKLSKADNDVSDKTRFSGRSTGVAGPSHFSKVHEMVELGQGQPNATLTKALRRLYGYPGESAVKSVAEAEGFLAEATHRRWAFDTATLAEEARRHLIAIADIVDAVRARRFLRSLLELDVVRVAITAAGGWSHVEALASNLKKVMGSADIHTPLTLLSDIEGLQRWLGNDDLWPFRAEEVLQQIFAFLAPVTENPRKRWRTANGAVELLREAALEAKHRLPFPAVNVVKGVTAAKAAVPMTQKGRSSDAGGDRSTKSKPSNASRKARRVRDEVMNHVDHDREKRGASRARPPRPTSSKKRHRRASIM